MLPPPISEVNRCHSLLGLPGGHLWQIGFSTRGFSRVCTFSIPTDHGPPLWHLISLSDDSVSIEGRGNSTYSQTSVVKSARTTRHLSLTESRQRASGLSWTACGVCKAPLWTMGEKTAQARALAGVDFPAQRAAGPACTTGSAHKAAWWTW